MVGITGVIWYPRGAAPNSAALVAGAGPVPLGVAAGAWSTVSSGLTDTAASISRVMADLRTGWSGEAADAALSKFAPFQEWAASAALLAGETAGKAQVQSGSYTVATLAMPSLAEIAAVQAAKVAAYSIGGALVGGAAAAEAAEEALKIRAAVTMETYDAATTHLAVQQNFDSPPSIAEPTAGASASAESPGSAARQSVVQAASTLADVIADPVRAATAAVASVASNPVFAAAASQAGAISGGASAAVSAATTAVTGATTAASTLATAGAGLTGLGGAGLGGAGLGGARLGASTPSLFGAPSASRATAQVSAASATTGAGAFAGSSSSSSTGRHALPDPSTGQSAARQNPVTSPVQGTVDTVKVDPARTAGGSAPIAGGRHAAQSQDETEHDTPDYLKHFEHFADGRTVIPSVIGGALETAER
ncbi:PPE family protein [Rhodococcus erythropolis]|jgi:PPE-repeat protein|uniref:PPE family protein n=1 Tax=Rhodococcus erythropolis TaxID=1833 RepID=A0A6G9CL93_RHOER|nr:MULTISPECIES: PPE domain-containing protein [Rhodococcus]MCJ0900085.1 PPE family protein [Rhodococcus sp. ARC_M13]QIP37466.1 PPE family protein [Rhodococcus erythropolis]UKO86845.1 PPE family protein [Rhodococcus erythropolis]